MSACFEEAGLDLENRWKIGPFANTCACACGGCLGTDGDKSEAIAHIIARVIDATQDDQVGRMDAAVTAVFAAKNMMEGGGDGNSTNSTGMNLGQIMTVVNAVITALITASIHLTLFNTMKGCA